MAWLLLAVDAKWRTEAVTIGSHGPTKAGGKSFCPGTEASLRQPIQMVAMTGWGDQFALIDVVCGAFPLRIPSDCPPLTTPRALERSG